MPELKLGTKYECYNCGTKFYDLGKSAAMCPKCGADQKDAVSADSPAVSQSARRRRKAEVVKPLDVEDDEAIEDIGPVAAADDEMVEPTDLDDADLEEDEEEFDDEA